MRARYAAPPVATWVAAQPPTTLFTTSVSKAEIFYGIAILPDGARRSSLAMLAERMLEDIFARRVLAFDSAAAEHYASIVAVRRGKGRPIQEFDGLIAAIARNAGAQVATRDVDGFADCELTIINPWNAGEGTD
jgi:toxin FitB